MTLFGKRILPVGWYFELLYFGVAVATFEHTAWSFGTTFLGMPSTDYFDITDPVWFRGALVALAVDIGMFLVARAAIEEGGKEVKSKMAIWGLYITFMIIGLISFFSQIIFAVYHTPYLEIASGVSEYWTTFLDPLIEAAPFLMAGALPLMAVIFTVSRAAMHQNVRTIEKQTLNPQDFKLKVDGQIKQYGSLAGVKKALTRYEKSGKKVLVPDAVRLQLEGGN